MKAKQIIYDHLHFRSKLEARWYIFMKKLGWNIEYEPEIEGLYGWLPDFLIIGKKHKTLVDVKPIHTREDWFGPSFEDARKKIFNSGIKNLHNYELMILGTNLQLDKEDSMGVFYIRNDENDLPYMKAYALYEDGNVIFSRAGDACSSGIGFMTYMMGWMCRISGEGGKTYLHRNSHFKDPQFEMIDRYWNEAQKELRWKGNEVV
jgi:hypothetical protein